MELSDFIEKSIVDICIGIRRAQAFISNETSNYPIAPAFMDGKPAYNYEFSKIEFDIYVTETESKTAEATGAGNIKVLSAFLSLEENKKTENASRI